VCPGFVLVAQAEEGPLGDRHRHQAPGAGEAGAFHEELAEAALAGWLVRFRPEQPAGERVPEVGFSGERSTPQTSRQREDADRSERVGVNRPSRRKSLGRTDCRTLLGCWSLKT
jgi:hypothetical protein